MYSCGIRLLLQRGLLSFNQVHGNLFIQWTFCSGIANFCVTVWHKMCLEVSKHVFKCNQNKTEPCNQPLLRCNIRGFGVCVKCEPESLDERGCSWGIPQSICRPLQRRAFLCLFMFIFSRLNMFRQLNNAQDCSCTVWFHTKRGRWLLHAKVPDRIGRIGIFSFSIGLPSAVWVISMGHR